MTNYTFGDYIAQFSAIELFNSYAAFDVHFRSCNRLRTWNRQIRVLR